METWKRATRDLPATKFQLTPERRVILNVLTRYPSLYTSHLHQLASPTTRRETFCHLLERLFDHGYIERDIGPNTHQLRHWLSTAGKRLIEWGDIEIGPEAVNVARPKGYARLGEYHSRVIIDVVASLEIAARKNGLPYRLLGEITDGLDDPLRISGFVGDAKNPIKERSIEMDGLIEINGKAYAIEVELSSTRTRSELTGSSFYKKLLVYRDFINKKRGYQERYQIDNLRVLVVTGSAAKQTRWMDLIGDSGKKSSIVLFRHFPMLHTTNLTPKPYDDILTGWERVGLPPTTLWE